MRARYCMHSDTRRMRCCTSGRARTRWGCSCSTTQQPGLRSSDARIILARSMHACIPGGKTKTRHANRRGDEMGWLSDIGAGAGGHGRGGPEGGDMGAAIFNLARRLARTARDLGSTTESSGVAIHQVRRVWQDPEEGHGQLPSRGQQSCPTCPIDVPEPMQATKMVHGRAGRRLDVKRRETLPNLKAAGAKAGEILAAKNAAIADVFCECGAFCTLLRTSELGLAHCGFGSRSAASFISQSTCQNTSYLYGDDDLFVFQKQMS